MDNSDLELLSRVQLRDIAKHIDRNANPERYARIREILSRPAHIDPPEETEDEIRERTDSDSWIETISVELMILILIGLLCLLGYAAY